jgi:hypothetical protein
MTHDNYGWDEDEETIINFAARSRAPLGAGIAAPPPAPAATDPAAPANAHQTHDGTQTPAPWYQAAEQQGTTPPGFGPATQTVAYAGGPSSDAPGSIGATPPVPQPQAHHMPWWQATAGSPAEAEVPHGADAAVASSAWDDRTPADRVAQAGTPAWMQPLAGTTTAPASEQHEPRDEAASNGAVGWVDPQTGPPADAQPMWDLPPVNSSPTVHHAVSYVRDPVAPRVRPWDEDEPTAGSVEEMETNVSPADSAPPEAPAVTAEPDSAVLDAPPYAPVVSASMHSAVLDAPPDLSAADVSPAESTSAGFVPLETATYRSEAAASADTGFLPLETAPHLSEAAASPASPADTGFLPLGDTASSEAPHPIDAPPVSTEDQRSSGSVRLPGFGVGEPLSAPIKPVEAAAPPEVGGGALGLAGPTEPESVEDEPATASFFSAPAAIEAPASLIDPPTVMDVPAVAQRARDAAEADGGVVQDRPQWMDSDSAQADDSPGFHAASRANPPADSTAVEDPPWPVPGAGPSARDVLDREFAALKVPEPAPSASSPDEGAVQLPRGGDDAASRQEPRVEPAGSPQSEAVPPPPLGRQSDHGFGEVDGGASAAAQASPPSAVRAEDSEDYEPRAESEMEKTNFRLPVRPSELVGDVAWLVILKSPTAHIHQLYRLDALRMELGRAFDAPIFVDDKTVSSRHAALRYERVEDRSEFVLYDLASTNGTYVNGSPIHMAPLKDDDRIRVGETELVFKKVGDAPAAQS